MDVQGKINAIDPHDFLDLPATAGKSGIHTPMLCASIDEPDKHAHKTRKTDYTQGMCCISETLSMIRERAYYNIITGAIRFYFI